MPIRSHSSSKPSVQNESDSDGQEEYTRLNVVSATETIKAGRLSDAIKDGDMAKLQALLDEGGGSLASYKSQFGTLLHLAASFGASSIFMELHKQGIDLNVQSSDGSTALHVAAKLGRHEIVEAILNIESVDDTIRDAAGMTAAEVGKSKQIMSLIEYSRNIHQLKKTKEMHVAVHRGDIQCLKNIFQSPRNQYLIDINAFDPAGDSPLHIAARNNNLDMVALCIKLGADPYLKNKKNKLPIELCRDEAVKAMLKEAPMVHPRELPVAANPNVKLEGSISKWANYAEGYKRRWFVLEDGIISYYKNQEDYPVSCRGSINVQFCRALEHPNDRYRFEIVVLSNSVRYHLRADTVAEAKKWVIAINEARRHLVTDTKPSTSLFQSPVLSQLVPKPSQKTELKRALDDCLGVLSRSEAALLRLCDAADGLEPEHRRAIVEYIVEETEFHKAFGRLLASIEEIESGHETELLSLKQQIEFLEDSLKAYAMEDKMNKTREGPEVNAMTEEFFDAVELEESPNISRLTGSPSAKDDKPIVHGYPMTSRASIPCDSSKMPPVNLWSILKGLVGKDLFRFPLPVNFSEPLSMLQRLAEDVEYAELLDKAAGEPNPVVRIQYVAAFAVSCYSSTDSRITKPFNPLLGETFEHIDNRRGFRYISEQVSHHPPISACHCEGRDWIFWSEVNVTNKFLGKSLDISPEGWNHVIIKSTGDHYVWKKVQMSIYNLIIGKLWIDHYGHMVIDNRVNGRERCELEFKAYGWRGTHARQVVGEVVAGEGAGPTFKISGHWNTSLVSRDLSTGRLFELWRRHPLLSNASVMYMFTKFAMTLNQLEPELEQYLCPTDSRFRPDQRAMEEGRWEDANALKVQLEEKQRTTRKLLSSQSDFVYKPRWFAREQCNVTNDGQWTYVGGYWEARESKDWSEVPGIPSIYL